MISDVTSQQFFDQKYRDAEDPWKFATSAYERSRYQTTVLALSQRRYACAFEPGCSVGVLTEQLASLCDHLHAIDISEVAVRRAQQRCAHLGNVTVAQGALPAAIPSESFDLVVLSEIGYYFSVAELRSIAMQLIAYLRLSGVFLAVHWLGHSDDHLISGDQVHQVLSTLEELELDLSERHDGYRLDRWVRV